MPGARNTAASAAFALAAVDGVLETAPAEIKLPCGDLLMVLGTGLAREVVGESMVVTSDRAGRAVVEMGGDPANIGVEDGLVAGNASVPLIESGLLLFPPQGRQDTSFPSAEGARDVLRSASCSSSRPRKGFDAARLLRRDFGAERLWAMLSRRITLPRLPPALPLVKVG